MASLDSSLIGITAGAGWLSYQGLLSKLDTIYGYHNDREDAIDKLSGINKLESESLELFGERCRQLMKRAYPHCSMASKDEQGLRAFLLGLPE